MELNACIAEWRDGHLNLYMTGQMLRDLREGLSKTLLLDEERITIDSAYIGGAGRPDDRLRANGLIADLGSIPCDSGPSRWW